MLVKNLYEFYKYSRRKLLDDHSHYNKNNPSKELSLYIREQHVEYLLSLSDISMNEFVLEFGVKLPTLYMLYGGLNNKMSYENFLLEEFERMKVDINNHLECYEISTSEEDYADMVEETLDSVTKGEDNE